MGETLLAVRRAALAVYRATGEYPNAVFLDTDTLRELQGEDDHLGTCVEHGAPDRWYVAGMLVILASLPGNRARRIILPVHADLGTVITANGFRQEAQA